MKSLIQPKYLLASSIAVLVTVIAFISLEIQRSEKVERMFERVAERNESLVCGSEKMIDMEGNEYDTVKIDFQCWMAENMRSATDSRGIKTERYCYDGHLENCDGFGGLYSASVAETICPPGWRLPGDDDFKDMEKTIGLDPPEVDTNGWRGDPVGERLKDVSWGGMDDVGFGALPGGFIDSNGNARGMGEQAHFWGVRFSSDESWRRFLHSDESKIFRGVALRDLKFSVRCLKN